MSFNFSKKSVVFITGASRGIGRSLSIKISEIINPTSTLILIASSLDGLKSTKSQIKTCNVIIYPLDLSQPSENLYKKLFDETLSLTDLDNIENSLFIHNAGTTGILKETLKLTNVDEWKKYYDLNVISAIILNSLYVKTMKNLITNNLNVVNISSLCGRVPFLNLSMYGSGKAARELFFKVFALEEPTVLVLNYSPGPVDTDMFNGIIDNAEANQLKEDFKKTKETSVLKPEETVEKLINILKMGEYKSGDVIDYFD